MTTIRELLAESNLDLDQEVEAFYVSWTREPVEGPPNGPMRTRVPGPFIDWQINLTVAADQQHP